MAPAVAHTDAVFLRSAASEDGKQKTYTFRLSDGGTDRYKTRFDPEGWVLENFNANPVVYLEHDGWFGELPIARGHAYKKDSELLLDVTFDASDEKALAVQRKVEGGFLRAVSIGAKPLAWADEANADGSFTCVKQELIEASIVGMPGNPRSLRVRSLAGRSLDLADLDEATPPQPITGDELFARTLALMRKE